MKIGLGIDTGGTYTDSVIIDLETSKVLSTAKALTTKENLVNSIEGSINLLDQSYLPKIKLVSISTTLATNSIVEGKGCKVGLIVSGHETYTDMPVEEFIEVNGGHDLEGKEVESLDIEKAKQFIETAKNLVEAFAVTSYLSIRNPEHELLLKELILRICGYPVVCGHELSSELGFRERTITAVLNARLIPIIKDLIISVKRVMRKMAIYAPLMVVKGDGSLMDEATAINRPVETILSGPTASVIGGGFLTKEKDGIVVDMGGTTTDIGILREGKPYIEPEGATIGGWKTRVKALDILTSGIGGDSRVIVFHKKIHLSPKRVTPLCIAAKKYPQLLEKLEDAKNLKIVLPFSYEDFQKKGLIQTTDFFALIKFLSGLAVTEKERGLIEILKAEPQSLYEVRKKTGIYPYEFNTKRLEDMNIIMPIGFTPTDALHVQGVYTEYDVEAAKIGAEILAKRAEMDVETFTKKVIKEVENKIAFQILMKLIYEKIRKSNDHSSEIFDLLIDNFLKGINRDDFICNILVKKPILAIGAPVEAYFPNIATMLNTRLVIPEYTGVANAIGAIISDVIETIEFLIEPKLGFAHMENPPCLLYSSLGRKEFETLKEAVEFAKEIGLKHVVERATASGAEEIKTDIKVENKEGHIPDGWGRPLLLETRVVISAIGKPGLTISISRF